MYTVLSQMRHRANTYRDICEPGVSFWSPGYVLSKGVEAVKTPTC
jgi:hypothetical protein